MSILKTAKASKAIRLGAALTLAAASVVALSTSSQAAGAGLSPNYLPDNAAAVVVLTGTGFKSPAGTVLVDTVGANNGVVFGTGTCAATNSGSTMTDATARTVVSATRVTITMPAIDVTAKTDYNLCVYRVTSGVLLASAKFSVYPAPTSGASNPVSPAKGPQTGGQTVTIEGTNFTSKTTVKWGTFSLTSVKIAKDGLSLTAVTPAMTAGGPTGFTVTNEGGSVVTTNTYTVVNAITVSPTVVAAGASETLTIKGSGFSTLTFVAADTAGVDSTDGANDGTNSAGPHVYLTRGDYSPTGYNATTNKANGQVAECINPSVVSDTELVCTFDTAYSVDVAAGDGVYDYNNSALAAGAYSVVVVANGGSAGPGAFESAISGTSTVTVGDF